VSVLRGLGNAYMALPDPRPEAAEETFATLLEVLRVHADGRALSAQDAAAAGLRERVRPGERVLLAEVYSQRARAAIAMGDDEAAARWSGEAADWSPPDRALLRAAGMAWRKIGRPKEALPYLERATAVARPEERAAAEREARDAADAAAKTDSDRFLEGKRAFDAHEMRRARLAFEDVVRERPDFVEARVMLAMSAHGQGDLRTAIDALAAAKEVLEKRTPGANGEDDASLSKLVEKLLADYRSEWGK
jgi:tetratricopeptide (TPR) repeat protein